MNSALQENSYKHIPVMPIEVIDYLNLQPDGIYLDGTIGAGGHATEILAQLSLEGKLIGLDRDAEALEICKAVLVPLYTQSLHTKLHTMIFQKFSASWEYLN